VVADLEALSKGIQRDRGGATYLSPVLAGAGEAGTLAYAALAQAPTATLGGAVSLDAAAALATPVALCPGAPSSPAPPGRFAYGPRADLPGWWTVGGTGSPEPWLAAALAAAGTGARFTRTDTAGSEPERLAKLVAGALAAHPTAAGTLRGLPLIELPVTRLGRAMAVIYSGDGGWRDLDKQVGEVLAGAGIPVVGVDSLRYFWHRQTPERVATDLAAIIEHSGAAWHRDRVALIGYSFGAGVLPFAVRRLEERARARVAQLSLLGLEHRAAFEVSLGEWLGTGGDLVPVAPEIAHLEPGLVQCFYGEDEEDTLCPELGKSGVEVIARPGGHHFDGNYQLLAQTILGGLERRLAGASPP
jgi:type IV secretory pathway VirJ component